MAANKLEGEVEITLDKRRILKLTWRGMSLFSQETGRSVDQFIRECGDASLAQNLPRMDHLARLLWACLIHSDRMLTIEQAEDLFEYADGKNPIEKQIFVMGKLYEVWMLRQGFEVKKEETNENPPLNSVSPPS